MDLNVGTSCYGRQCEVKCLSTCMCENLVYLVSSFYVCDVSKIKKITIYYLNLLQISIE